MGKIFPIFSGSKGNCTYIASGDSGILIDAGTSCKKITESFEKSNLSLSSIKAVFITHEHSDHISGLPVLVKKLGVPVYTSPKTSELLLEKFPKMNIIGFETEITVNGIKIKRFNTSHDCVEGSGYCVFLPDGTSCATCTDTGILSNGIFENLLEKNLVLIESNHDVTMLKNGPYPPELKMRILSEKGHLSNTDCACAIAKLVKQNTRRFVLAHLSENNNLPTLAKSSTVSYLLDNGFYEDKDYTLYIAKPNVNKIIYF